MAKSSFAGAGSARAVQTGRLVALRYPTPRDRTALMRLRIASREHLERWEPKPEHGFDPWGEAFFDNVLKTRRTDTRERLLVCLVESGEIAGMLSLSNIVRGPLQSCFLGYWIGVGFTGRGCMTEAVGLAVRHAFITLGLHRVEANIQSHNEASRAVVRKNGFRLEGYSPRYLQIAGRWADHERWAITAEETGSNRVSASGRSRVRSRPST